MKKAETQWNAVTQTITCILIGFIAVLLALTVCAFGVFTNLLTAVPYEALSSVCLILGCLLAAWRAARCSPRQKLLWALVAGSGVLLCLIACGLLSSFLSDNGSTNWMRVAVNAGCAFAASLLGGFLGATGRRKKKKH